MRIRPATTASLALVALALSAGACSSTGDADTAPTSQSSTSSAAPSASSPSASPSTTSLQDVKDQQAEDAVVAYIALTDALGADPNRSLEELEQVAADQALLQSQYQLTSDRSAGITQSGATVVVSNDASYAGDNTYQVTSCLDVSQIDLVDAQGQSVVAPGREGRVIAKFPVSEISGKFYVTEDMQVQELC